MTIHPWLISVLQSTAFVVAGAAAGADMPFVKLTCVISWDQSPDRRVAEYHLNVWMVDGEQPPVKMTHVVKAPKRQVSCQEAGVQAIGRWKATAQACLGDGTCREETDPISFRVVEH
jgi:hypothetical protein